mgnify:CR=1 FL=1
MDRELNAALDATANRFAEDFAAAAPLFEQARRKGEATSEDVVLLVVSHARLGDLAERLRPKHLDEVIGQSHLLGPEKVLRKRYARIALPTPVPMHLQSGGGDSFLIKPPDSAPLPRVGVRKKPQMQPSAECLGTSELAIGVS